MAKKKVDEAKALSVHSTANLIYVKNRTLSVEAELESMIRKISKKHKIDFGRSNDYCHRSFNVTIVFDQFNIDAFSDENIKKIRELYKEFLELRKKIKPLEKEYDVGVKIAQDMKNNMMQL